MTPTAQEDAAWTAPLLALAGPGLGGIILSEDAEESWCAAYAPLAPQNLALRTIPSSVGADQLAGAVDLAATLATGAAVHQRGLLQRGTASAFLVRRATGLEAVSLAMLAESIDRAELVLAATDDSMDEEESVSSLLTERLAFRISEPVAQIFNAHDLEKARHIMSCVRMSTTWVEALCAACLSLGIQSLRAGVLAVTTAKALAALQGRLHVEEEDVTRAARLVLAHRALRLPQANNQDEPTPPPPNEEAASQPEPSPANQKPADAEIIVAAIKAALPPHVLQDLSQGHGKKSAARARNEKRKKLLGANRGRVTGTMRARSISRQKLNILATLRQAAPWQILRKQQGQERMVVLRDDLRVSRHKQRTEATAIFAVDASGSTAFQRLAEAKGAVETLLSECYVRRDRVAMVSFRGRNAEVLLPPSRSLERARRALTALAGGGGTPMAAALDQVYAIADQVKRTGGKPIVILLTDGRANITREGVGDKVKAMAETEEAATRFAAQGFEAMVLDVSPEPQKSARALAQLLAGRYLHLPRARATDLAAPVRSALQRATR